MVLVMGAWDGSANLWADTSSDTGSVSPAKTGVYTWILSLYAFDTFVYNHILLRVQSYTASCTIMYCFICRECLRTFRQLDCYPMWWWDPLAVLILPQTGSASQTGVELVYLDELCYIYVHCLDSIQRVFDPKFNSGAYSVSLSKSNFTEHI